MNERMKELFKREYGYYPSPGELVEAEKFAELIVKECADVAADHDALDIYEEIREHFGVEE